MKLIDVDNLKHELFDADWMTDNDEHMVEEIVERQKTVDAIPIDDVAKMLADLFGDCIACNYNKIDQYIEIDCEKDACPDDGDYSCWKKYVMYLIENEHAKMDGVLSDD